MRFISNKYLTSHTIIISITIKNLHIPEKKNHKFVEVNYNLKNIHPQHSIDLG